MGGGDIENPDGGDYIATTAAAAAAKDDADAAMTKRCYPTDEAFCWFGSIGTCCSLALVFYVSYETVKSHPASITGVVRLNLCMLLLICFAVIVIYVLVCGFPVLPSKVKKPS